MQKDEITDKHFIPNERIFVLIGNADYEKRRKEKRYEEFSDLPAVYEDLDNMRQGLKEKLGA